MAIKVVNKIIKKYNINFDLIHAHFTYPSGYVAAKLKEIHEKKFILTIHEYGEWFSNEILSKDRKLIYTWQSADKIVRVNKMDLKKFDNLEIDKSKLLYIPNGFSSDMFKPKNMLTARKKLDLPIDKRILVNIANLEEYKGQKYLIKSMEKVLVAQKDVMLYIVGEGSLRNRLQSMIQEYGLQKNVELAGGNKPREEIPIWMQACDVFVLPSLSEGNPTVMFEALGCGKPFIGTNVDGIPEIIINYKLGNLVEPRDANGLAEAILSALDNKWDGDYIRDYAGQFTWDRIAERLLDIYETILN
jgi:glycosyltransferase involved in cell wall biosynthesis